MNDGYEDDSGFLPNTFHPNKDPAGYIKPDPEVERATLEPDVITSSVAIEERLTRRVSFAGSEAAGNGGLSDTALTFDNMTLERDVSLPNLHTDDVMRMQGLATKRCSSLTHYDPRGLEDIHKHLESALDEDSQSG